MDRIWYFSPSCQAANIGVNGYGSEKAQMNLLLDEMDYTSREAVEEAIWFYGYVSEKGEAFLKEHDYSEEEVFDGLQMLAKRSGYEELIGLL